ncbi:MAG: ABC transporter ATP-binding protein [Burkholderiales bacterium]|nr:ABC transporter ATP-binding protein [Burkholderiales bacterium]
MLEIKNISYQVKNKVLLSEITAKFELGSISGIIGSNGAGKSTLLKIISGENKANGGEIYLADKQITSDYKEFPAHMRAVVSQSEIVMADISVVEYVLLGCLVFSISGQYSIEDYKKVERALDFIGSSNLSNRSLSSLSGGERQRIQLARALVQLEDENYQYSGYLFLDEFSANMDIYFQKKMLELLKRLVKNQTLAVIIIAHDLGQIMNYFDYCLLLKNGSIVSFGTPADVLTDENIKDAYNINLNKIEVNGKYYFAY